MAQVQRGDKEEVRDLNQEARKITWFHQRKCNLGKYRVNGKSSERQGTKLARFCAQGTMGRGAMIRFRNQAIVGVS